ncbi:MAG: type II toxin-antitoxin system prevent-host-death family antitoxin [Acidimicrobiia bacterium]|nr:type II toxin-antitoxin system prevent-host-death family antitoxin [Acidimicrobiia bacterium]
MDVAVTDFRARLRHWLDQARDGEELVVTERGVPVAKVIGLATTAIIESLVEQGKISKPSSPDRPVASGRPRPRSRRSVSEKVSEQRD